MNLESLGSIALALYLAVLVGVAELARRAKQDASPSDHFLASRGLGTWVLFLTLYATAYSGNSLLGYPGKAYRSGFSFIQATGFMLSIIVCFHALAPRLRPLAVSGGFVTPGDYLRRRFGQDGAARWLAMAVGVLMAIALANFLLAQLKAMGHVAETVTGGAVPYEAGVIGLAAMILFYETLGGMRAVAWTDTAQSGMMVVGLGALLGWLFVESGGFESMTRAIAQARPDAVAVPDRLTQANWFSTIVLMGIASVIYPQAIQRIYAAESGTALRQSFALMSVMPFVTTLVVTLIGVAAIPLISVEHGVASDEVLPLLLAEWSRSSPWAVAGALVVFIGALAAIMSTADSCLLSLGAVAAHDLLGRRGADAGTTRVGKTLAALGLLAMIPLALQREITLWRLIELKMELLIQCAPAFLVALHWPGLRAGPALAGVLAGVAFGVGLTLADIPRIGGVHVGVIGLGLNLLIAVAGSRRPLLAEPARP